MLIPLTSSAGFRGSLQLMFMEKNCFISSRLSLRTHCDTSGSHHNMLLLLIHTQLTSTFINLLFAGCSSFNDPAHLSVGRRGVSNFLSHLREDGHEPALSVKLFPETSTDTAEQSGQEVLVAGTELTVLQVVLQQPEAEEQSVSFLTSCLTVVILPSQTRLTRRDGERCGCRRWLCAGGSGRESCPGSIRTSEPEARKHTIPYIRSCSILYTFKDIHNLAATYL